VYGTWIIYFKSIVYILCMPYMRSSKFKDKRTTRQFFFKEIFGLPRFFYKIKTHTHKQKGEDIFGIDN